jgi:hypothetical protein
MEQLLPILFEHSPQRSLGKRIYRLILFSTLFACYVSSLLFQIVLLLTKWQVSNISIYDYLYIMSHVNLRLNFCPGSLVFLAPPLIRTITSSELWTVLVGTIAHFRIARSLVLSEPIFLLRCLFSDIYCRSKVLIRETSQFSFAFYRTNIQVVIDLGMFLL